MMNQRKIPNFLGIVFCLICFLLVGDQPSGFITAGSAANYPIPNFRVTFQGEVTDFDFETYRISVEGNANGTPIGEESTFTADGTIENWNTAAGVITIVTQNGSTITANLVGHLVGIDSFRGTYEVIGGTGDFDTSEGGSGIVSGTFNLARQNFQGRAVGDIIY
jgi:hypothetical protein